MRPAPPSRTALTPPAVVRHSDAAVTAQMLAADDRAEEALAELEAVRSLFGAVYGDGPTHVRNIERQIQRLRTV